MKLKPSERVWLQSAGVAALIVVGFDLVAHDLGLWPSLILGLLLAGGLYRVLIAQAAREKTLDR